ncbi:MAG TPA: hypothetical protein VGE41_06085 [Verrucomicrobiae bacterium]
MANELVGFKRNAVRPIECFKQGFDLIKGQYWSFVGITVVGILIGSLVPLGIIMGPMMCGIYLTLFQRMRGQAPEFSTLFKGFDYFVESLIATLLQLLPIMILIIPASIAFMLGMVRLAQQNGNRPPNGQVLLTFFVPMAAFVFIVMLISILVGVLFIFTYPLIIEKRLSGLNAVKTSVRAVFANFWPVLGLVMINFLLGLVGMVLCYVGAFFIMPISFGALAVAYQQVFGLEIPNSATLAPPSPPSVPV